ncbi:hypothetical protein BLA29_011540 [Euroglyphus maynei]|uniref:Uncharacterized protein n=1 Tax=Euroglyphus maynei TaxID=6958 RepID=A0A1Y3AXJ0_EURMA|nr:hypothetical protein BLA29_011540 [Euroglyphus maynei]
MEQSEIHNNSNSKFMGLPFNPHKNKNSTTIDKDNQRRRPVSAIFTSRSSIAIHYYRNYPM